MLRNMENLVEVNFLKKILSVFLAYFKKNFKRCIHQSVLFLFHNVSIFFLDYI